jgi:hypothetical protein
MYYGKELSCVCGYTGELDFMFNGKEILHFYGYCKTILILRLQATPILVDYKTSCIRNIISLSFHVYKKTSKSEVVRVLSINLKARRS